jgi:aspartate/methionine/tyrosine aminotransferase
VVLNFPNNPSGYTPTVEEGEKIIMALEESARSGNKLVVVLDDSYFGLVFENKVMTESLFARLARCHENILAVKADGLTKEEYAWGLRVGFLTYGIKNGTRELYKALEDKTAGAIRGNISNSSHISQSLFLRSINSEHYAEEKQQNKDKIAERYAKVKVVFQQHPEYKEYFEALPFNSGYFMCTRLEKSDPDKVWELLLSKYSTGVICYSEKALLRIAFASTPLGKIDKLFANIYLACKEVE